jgi:hypothetical protein
VFELMACNTTAERLIERVFKGEESSTRVCVIVVNGALLQYEPQPDTIMLTKQTLVLKINNLTHVPLQSSVLQLSDYFATTQHFINVTVSPCHLIISYTIATHLLHGPVVSSIASIVW